MKFSDIISRSDQYEVAHARAEIAYMGAVLIRSAEHVADLFLSRLDNIHKEES